MGNLWEAGKSFLAGFRRHFTYLVPAIFLIPFELYERVIRPNFGTDTWPEHLVIPASVFPWVLLATALWTSFLTYRDLFEEHLYQRGRQTERPRQPGQTEQPLERRQPPPPERIPANIPLDDLRGFFIGRTDPEGQRLAAPYIGKWVTVDAKVSQTQLSMPGPGPRCGVFWFNYNPRSTTVFLFDLRWKDQIELLRLGDEITVEGQIWIVDQSRVELDDCRLIDVKSA